MVQVKRMTTTADANITFSFDVLGFEFLVKNLTDDDILVCLGDTYNEDVSILIPAETAQVITVNKKIHLLVDGTKDITIKPVATSDRGVEVQCLVW